jgi:hypothetical protein
MTHSDLDKKIKETLSKHIFNAPSKAMNDLSKSYPFARFELIKSKEKDERFAFDCFYEGKTCRYSILKSDV